MSRQPDTVDGMIAQLRDVWGDDVEIRTYTVVEAWKWRQHPHAVLERDGAYVKVDARKVGT